MIRDATMSEIPRVVSLVIKGVEEMENVPYKPELDCTTDSVIQAFKQVPCKVVVIDDKIVGCASLCYTSSAWSNKPILTSIMVYVLPEHRNFATLKELYSNIRDTANLLGVPYMDNFHGSDKIDARARLSQAQNLKVIGINIMYDGK